MSKKLIIIAIILFIGMWWSTIYFFGIWGAITLITASVLFTTYLNYEKRK